MSRYIDADKINAKLMDEYHGMISDESMKIYKIIQMLDNAPTADVQEVKHAKWEVFGMFDDIVKCSCCGYEDTLNHVICENLTYCGKCGAKMDLEEK